MMNTRVKDIDFKSADHVIEEIRNMNVKGGSPFGRSAAWAFKLAIEQEDLNDFDTLKTRLEDVAKQMIGLKPTMATIHNSCDIVLSLLNKDKDLDELKKIGLDCINFSIDTLDEAEYLKICKKNNLKKVLLNLEYAYEIGIGVKVNCVVDNLFSFSRFESMLELIKDKKIALRFIELMPLKNSDRNTKMNELIEYVQKNYTLNAYDKKLGNGPAHYYTIPEFQGYIGFIEALHNKFCSECNRVRLSSVGRLKLCLFHMDGVDLKPYLNNLEELEKVMREWIFKKPKEHHFEEEHSSTVMNEIGG